MCVNFKWGIGQKQTTCCTFLTPYIAVGLSSRCSSPIVQYTIIYLGQQSTKNYTVLFTVENLWPPSIHFCILYFFLIWYTRDNIRLIFDCVLADWSSVCEDDGMQNRQKKVIVYRRRNDSYSCQDEKNEKVEKIRRKRKYISSKFW